MWYNLPVRFFVAAYIYFTQSTGVFTESGHYEEEKKMKRVLRAVVFCFMLLFMVAVWKHSTVKAAETLTEDKTYKIDLNGDGKKEKIKYTISGDLDEEEYSSSTFKLYVNGKVKLKQTEKKDFISFMNIYVKPFDYDPSDKNVDLLIEYYGRDDVSSTRVYRYKKKKLSLLFNADNARGWWANIPSEQVKDKYVIVENVRDSSIGDFYVPEQYSIKSKKLVFVKPKNSEYEISQFNRYDLDSIHWYEIENAATITLDDGSFDIINGGTEFYVTKLRCNTVADSSCNKDAQNQEVYITTDEGKSGWFDVSSES